MSQLAKISAIIVAYNEALLIEQIIAELHQQEFAGETEIILADGGSTDSTTALAATRNIQAITTSKKGKAAQMNAGAKVASGDILFFVHADMKFPKNTFTAIAEAINNGFCGGGFSNEFDTDNEKIKRLGDWMNFRIFDKREQSDKGIFYGDNGIFVLKDVFNNLKGFKEIPIMEDYDFSLRLSQHYRTFKIKHPKILVSARRHIKAGFFKTRLQWVLIRKLFKWGVSPFTLAKWYKDVR